jgi:hypothetical protein
MADHSNESITARDGSETARDTVNTGLCATCVHVRRIESAKGSSFVLCTLSASDSRFPKYPRLPVVACGGYTQRD